MSVLVAVLFAAVAAVTAARSPGWADRAPECPGCQGTGLAPCGKHPAAEARLETDVLYCSAIEDCAECSGIGFLPCKKCGEGKRAGPTLLARSVKLAVCKEGLKPLDEAMGRRLRKAESAHFVLVWEVDELKIGERRVKAHEALHVYLARLERLFEDYTRRLAVDATAFREKSRVFVWYLPKDHERATVAFCEGQPGEGGVKLLGLRPRYSVCASAKEMQRNDDRLHRNIAHSVTHLLLSHQQPIAWIGNMKGGWVDEGLAHWFEDKVVGICDSFCAQEASQGPLFENGRFRLGVRKVVAKDEAPPLAHVVQLNVDVLLSPLDAFAFSYVDYLLTLGGEKFDALVRKLKAKTPTSEAIQAVYGMNLLELESRWKAWVLETYPTR